jgi:hypothetical protein
MNNVAKRVCIYYFKIIPGIMEYVTYRGICIYKELSCGGNMCCVCISLSIKCIVCIYLENNVNFVC